jgi:hypothetical protein
MCYMHVDRTAVLVALGTRARGDLQSLLHDHVVGDLMGRNERRSVL